ncbi:MAG: TAXI family TRAP transporter solute-binding subunit, partial [Chloroflexota bacterium]
SCGQPSTTTSPSPGASKWPATLTIGTKEAPSTTYVVGVATVKILGKYLKNIDSHIAAYPGVMNWPQLMKDEKLDMGQFTIHSMYDAAVGQEYYKGQPPATWLRIMGYGEDASLGVIAVKGKGIKTPADLKGKKWMIVRPGSDLGPRTAAAYLAAYGLKEGDVTLVKHSSTDEFVSAVKEGRVDAMGWPVYPRGTPWAEELAIGGFIEFISDTPEAIAKISAANPFWHAMTIPANTYKGQTSDWKTVGFSSIWGVRSTLPDDLVYAVAQAAWDNFAEWTTYHAIIKGYKLPDSAKPEMMALPYHNGMVKYLKEKGYWTPAHETKQNELLATLQKAEENFKKSK